MYFGAFKSTWPNKVSQTASCFGHGLTWVSTRMYIWWGKLLQYFYLFVCKDPSSSFVQTTRSVRLRFVRSTILYGCCSAAETMYKSRRECPWATVSFPSFFSYRAHFLFDCNSTADVPPIMLHSRVVHVLFLENKFSDCRVRLRCTIASDTIRR